MMTPEPTFQKMYWILYNIFQSTKKFRKSQKSAHYHIDCSKWWLQSRLFRKRTGYFIISFSRQKFFENLNCLHPCSQKAALKLLQADFFSISRDISLHKKRLEVCTQHFQKSSYQTWCAVIVSKGNFYVQIFEYATQRITAELTFKGEKKKN